MERERGKDIIREIQRRGKDLQEQETESKIRESKYNRRYKYEYERKTGMPAYMKESRTGKAIKDKAKLRCGNTENANRYWLKKEKGNVCYVERMKEGWNTWYDNVRFPKNGLIKWKE